MCIDFTICAKAYCIPTCLCSACTRRHLCVLGLGWGDCAREGKPVPEPALELTFQSLSQLLSNCERPSSDGIPLGARNSPRGSRGEPERPVPLTPGLEGAGRACVHEERVRGLIGVGMVTPGVAMLGMDLVRRAATEVCREESVCGLGPVPCRHYVSCLGKALGS